jgi:hypothetical protein
VPLCSITRRRAAIMPNVYSKRRNALPAPAGAIVVDRTSRWGNVHKMRKDIMLDPREEAARVVALHRADLERMRTDCPVAFDKFIAPLRGKDLVCWCHGPDEDNPMPCHADTLLEFANA